MTTKTYINVPVGEAVNEYIKEDIALTNAMARGLIQDVDSMYPSILRNGVYGKFDSEKWVVAERKLKENLFEKYRNKVIRKMILQEVLDELEKEVWRVESRRIEGFTVGLCHARTIIEERLINK